MEIKNTTTTPTSAPGRIEAPRTRKSLESDAAVAGPKGTGVNQKAEGYNVEVSPEAQELKAAHAKAFEIAKGTSPVRAEKVAALKSQIQNGTYKVDSGNIADGILREAIREKLATSE